MSKKHHGKAPKKGVAKKQVLVPHSKEPLTEKTEKCPTCGGPVNVQVDSKGKPEAKAKLTTEIWSNLPPERPELLEHLKKRREGKKTICLLGTSPDNCNRAPWGEGLDMWAVNDAHRLPYMDDRIKEATGWFQIHHRWRFMASKEIPGSERLRYGMDHWKFLRDEELKFPIYMQRHYEDIPRSVAYPLRQVTEYLLNRKIERGFYFQRKYFTCSFAYMAGLVLWSQTQEGQDFLKINKPYERVEMYGIQLAQQVEYMMQKPSTEFWIGMMIARGLEIYVPENGYLLYGETYGYRNPHGNPALGQVDEENVGYWDWGDNLPDNGYRGVLTAG